MESRPQENSVRSGNPVPIDCEAEMGRYRPLEAANDLRMSQLSRTIELEIIPRLMLAHRTTHEAAADTDAAESAISADEVRQFARLVLSHDESTAYVMVTQLRERRVPVEKIYMDLLAPTARHLGELWTDDLCSFTDVTVGLGRLQRVLRELSSAFGQALEHAQGGRRILLLPSPGEQHTFGLVMVAEFFRHAGWDVIGGAWSTHADGVAMVSTEWFDVIGFSLGAEVRLDALTNAISDVRHASCNQQLAVLVGGPLFGLHPEYAARVGADGMTIDGREAPLLAESLITRNLLQHGQAG